MSIPFPHIRAAAIDGRCHNPYYRQTQLASLHDKLHRSIPAIKDAIAQDYEHSNVEIATQIHLTIDAVKRNYASVQPTTALLEENRITRSEDAPSTTRPAGIVYIEPSVHTIFYAVIVPLSAAIAAGNCVILLLENNLRASSSLLRRILSEALDRNTFEVASSPITDSNLLASMTVVNQNGHDIAPRLNQVTSLSKATVVAVVDRTANLQLAARELVAAQLCFGGSSPYAPDLVLVNEFVKESFLHAVTTESTRRSAAAASESTSATRDQARERSGIVVNDVSARKNIAQALQNPSSSFAVYAIKSLDDAIDLITSISPDPCLAAYHFCNAASGKYLTQFVDAYMSFINHIPKQLLVGPAYPVGHPVDLATRYPQALFCLARPVYINAPSHAIDLDATVGSRDTRVAQALLDKASSPLALMNRSVGGGVGFFEQGFLLNAAFVLVSTVGVTGTGIFWLLRYGDRYGKP